MGALSAAAQIAGGAVGGGVAAADHPLTTGSSTNNIASEFEIGIVSMVGCKHVIHED